MAAKILENYSLKGHNTFGIEANTRYFAEYSSVKELRQVGEMLRNGELPRPVLHIGEGSNLLFTKDFPGTILHSAIKDMEVLTDNGKAPWFLQDNGGNGDSVPSGGMVTVRVGSGYVWDEFVALCVEKGWYGAENLSGIPGETGAAAVQNIGAYGAEIKDLILRVECLDIESGNRAVFEAEDCGYAYRDSIFKQACNKKFIVTHVVFGLSTTPVWNFSYKALADALGGPDFHQDDMGRLQKVRNTIISIRDSKLPNPAVIGSAGSFFKNPVVPIAKAEEIRDKYPQMPSYPAGDGMVKLSAGWLIEKCGWKGRTLGRAGVYEKQALVLVNLGGATGKDIVTLATAVTASVKENFGVDLHPEVNYI